MAKYVAPWLSDTQMAQLVALLSEALTHKLSVAAVLLLVDEEADTCRRMGHFDPCGDFLPSEYCYKTGGLTPDEATMIGNMGREIRSWLGTTEAVSEG